MRKSILVFFSFLVFHLLLSCSDKKELDKNKQLQNIIQSEIIKENHKKSYFNDSRNENIFISIDSSGAKYLVDLNDNELINFNNELNNEERLKKTQEVLNIKERMDLLNIKSIFTGNKYNTIYTNIKSDSTYKEITHNDPRFKDLNFDKDKGDYFFALINFKDSKLDSNLIKKYKMEHGIRNFDKDWFYFRYQK